MPDGGPLDAFQLLMDALGAVVAVFMLHRMVIIVGIVLEFLKKVPASIASRRVMAMLTVTMVGLLRKYFIQPLEYTSK